MMVTPQIETYKTKLDATFARYPYREAHTAARPILVDLSKDIEALHSVFAAHLGAPEFLFHPYPYPDIGIDVIVTPTYTVRLNNWFPRPGAPHTHQSVHHHGKLLLTSLAAFGPGYDSIVYKSVENVDEKSGTVHLEIDRVYNNTYGNIEFIDHFVPHVVFFPRSFSSTLVLWSYDERPALEAARSNPLLYRHRRFIKMFLEKIGLAKVLGLNTVSNLDYFPETGSYKPLGARLEYPSPSLVQRPQNILHILQQYGFTSRAEINKIANLCPENIKNDFSILLEKYTSGTPVDPYFESNYLKVPKVSISLEEFRTIHPSLKLPSYPEY